MGLFSRYSALKPLAVHAYCLRVFALIIEKQLSKKITAAERLQVKKRKTESLSLERGVEDAAPYK